MKASHMVELVVTLEVDWKLQIEFVSMDGPVNVRVSPEIHHLACPSNTATVAHEVGAFQPRYRNVVHPRKAVCYTTLMSKVIYGAHQPTCGVSMRWVNEDIEEKR